MVKQPFYLFKRRISRKVSVYYWYRYDSHGNRTTPKSTGYSKKQEAFNYVLNLLKDYDPVENPVLFNDFTENIFDENSEFIKNKKRKRPIKPATILTYNTALKHLRSYFGKYRLDEITSKMIEEFMIKLSDEGKKNATINIDVAVLKIVLLYAQQKELIKKNPFDLSIERYRETSSREAFTQEEINTLLSKKWSNYTIWLYFLTDALTGMRASELLGLKEEEIKDGYIDLQTQFIFNEDAPLKTNQSRFITLPRRLEVLLRAQAKRRYKYLFSQETPSNTPYNNTSVRHALYKQYTAEMKATQKKRTLTTHSFRYYFNTYLISHGISETKTNFCLGHSSGKGSMLTLYTTWRPEMYEDVRKLQDDILDSILTKETIDFIFENNTLSSPDRNLFLERLS